MPRRGRPAARQSLPPHFLPLRPACAASRPREPSLRRRRPSRPPPPPRRPPRARGPSPLSGAHSPALTPAVPPPPHSLLLHHFRTMKHPAPAGGAAARGCAAAAARSRGPRWAGLGWAARGRPRGAALPPAGPPAMEIPPGHPNPSDRSRQEGKINPGECEREAVQPGQGSPLQLPRWLPRRYGALATSCASELHVERQAPALRPCQLRRALLPRPTFLPLPRRGTRRDIR